MKKINKILIAAVIGFVASVSSVSAMGLTVNELGKKIEVQRDGMSAYIVGEYVFTNKKPMNTSDLMLASRSINPEDSAGKTNEDYIYKEMTIHEIIKVSSGNWIILDNKNGETELTEDDELNINFIDYNEVIPESSVKIEAHNQIVAGVLEDLKIKKATKDDLVGGDFIYNETNGKLTGLVKLYEPEDTEELDEIFTVKDQTGYYIGFRITLYDLSRDSVVTLYLRDGSTKTVKYNQITVDGNNPSVGYLLVLCAIDKNDKNKTIKFSYDADGAKLAYDDTAYTIDYSDVVFQQYSSINGISLLEKTEENKNETYITNMTSLGYSFDSTLTEVKINGYNLSGVLRQQNVGNGYVVPVSIKISKEFTGYVSADVNTYGGYFREGYYTALVQLDPDAKEKVIKLTIDQDASGDPYLAKEYTIDYSGVDFRAQSYIHLNVFANVNAQKIIYIGDKLTSPVLDDTYVYYNGNSNITYERYLQILGNLKVDYWTDKDGKKFSDSTIKEPVVLNAHLVLDVNKVIADRVESINKLYNDYFTVEFSNNTIKYLIKEDYAAQYDASALDYAISLIISDIYSSRGVASVKFTYTGGDLGITDTFSSANVADSSSVGNLITRGATYYVDNAQVEYKGIRTLLGTSFGYKMDVVEDDDDTISLDNQNKTYSFKFEAAK